MKTNLLTKSSLVIGCMLSVMALGSMNVFASEPTTGAEIVNEVLEPEIEETEPVTESEPVTETETEPVTESEPVNEVLEPEIEETDMQPDIDSVDDKNYIVECSGFSPEQMEMLVTELQTIQEMQNTYYSHSLSNQYFCIGVLASMFVCIVLYKAIKIFL